MSRTFEVDVNPDIIRWTRESAGWSIEEIASKLKTSVENYKRIELGIKKPTYRQLELLSKYLKRPLSVFFLPEPPYEEPIASSFRILPKAENLYSKEFRLSLRKARYYQSVAIELMNAAQALEFRRPLKSSPMIEDFVAEYRKVVPFVENDQVMYQHIANSVEFLRDVEVSFSDALVEGI